MEILSGLQGRAARVIELATWGKDYVTWLFPARVAKMAPTGAASVENSQVGFFSSSEAGAAIPDTL